MPIEIPEIIQVKELATKLNKPVGEVISKLMSFGIIANLNQDIDYDTAAIVADEFGFQASPLISLNLPSLPMGKKGVKEVGRELEPRPPVVTIMGHVDHGKTTLLDFIRQSKLAEAEVGGITQHISATQIEINGRKVTFLDTPGHSAFEATRKHGANITDLVILVVAADDGVKPQTVEVINHATLAHVPILVAINKIDKPEADLEKVKRQLADLNLLVEEWGGQIVMVPISAKTGQGVDKLLEMIFLVTDLSELKADFLSPGIGVIIESHLVPGIGPQATVLIQNGLLKLGDFVNIGPIYGKIKTLQNDRLKRIEYITPGSAGLISGLSGLPEFSDQLLVVSSEKEAKESAKSSLRSRTVKSIKSINNLNLEEATEKREGKTLFKVIIKADTQSSISALEQSLKNLENDDVGLNIVSAQIGDINESDIKLARSTKATIIGFSIKINSDMMKLAQSEKVKYEIFNIIYHLLDHLESILQNLMPELQVEVELGELEILAVFRDNKKNKVCGGRVISGEITKTLCQIKRGEKLLAKGKIIDLRKGKEQVNKVGSNSECGIELEIEEKLDPEYDTIIKETDRIVVYQISQQKKPYIKKTLTN